MLLLFYSVVCQKWLSAILFIDLNVRSKTSLKNTNLFFRFIRLYIRLFKPEM